MLRLIGVVGLLGGLTLLAGGADPPAKAPEPLPIEKLVGQLGDRSFRVREAAGRALEARGEEALPVLRQALAAADPEARRRLEVLTERIERTVLLTPRRVTLALESKPAKDVVAEIAKQTGYKLHWQGNDQTRLSLDLKNATYWEALEKVLNDTGATLNMDDQSGGIHLYQQDVHSPYYHHNGAFRFQAMNFQYNRFVNLMNLPRNGQNQDQQNTNLYFGFQVQAEPKAPLVGIGEPRLLKAEDENGLSLVPVQNEASYVTRYYENGGFRNFSYQTQVNLGRPSKDATRAKLIKGRLPVILLASTRPELTLAKLAKGQKAQSAAVELELEDVQEQNKQYFLTMTIKRFERHAEADPNWANCVWQRLELHDAKGRKYLAQGPNNFINGSPTVVQASFQFAPPPAPEGKIGEPVKLIYNHWVTLSHEVEFEFHDVPLP